MINPFSKIEVNVPMLERIQKVSEYAKCLKDSCTHKERHKPNELVQVGPKASALFNSQLPVKCKDPGAFSIPCTIGKITIPKALLDLGAAINVMPSSICHTLGVNLIKLTSVLAQLADKRIINPEGILEDILVQVKELIFLVDFYVLDMSNKSLDDSTLILGRPFMKIANTMIGMKNEIIKVEFGGHITQFNKYKHPHEDHSLLGLNLIGTSLGNECNNIHELEIDDEVEEYSISNSATDFSVFSSSNGDALCMNSKTDGWLITMGDFSSSLSNIFSMGAGLTPSGDEQYSGRLTELRCKDYATYFERQGIGTSELGSFQFNNSRLHSNPVYESFKLEFLGISGLQQLKDMVQYQHNCMTRTKVDNAAFISSRGFPLSFGYAYILQVVDYLLR